MYNYTKYTLKGEDELTRLFQGKDNFVILACNKCFTVFKASADMFSAHVAEVESTLRLLGSLGRTVADVRSFDFLCNRNRTENCRDYFIELTQKSFNGESADAAAAGRAANNPADGSSAVTVLVIACGIGMQTVCDVIYGISPDLKVITACNSTDGSGYHGMSLTDKLCRSCGQCFLSSTSGLCPVSGCAKSLLNGQCGGAKNGKCEVNGTGENDCVWEKITQKSLPAAGKDTPVMPSETGVFSYDCNRVKRSDTNAFALAVQMKRNESFKGGLYLDYRKASTAFLTFKEYSLPDKVVIPMSQHAGMSAEPVVSIGDHVKTGQKIGEAVGTLSSSVHASISGTVTAIDCRSHPNSTDDVQCVTIESDGKDELHKSVIPIPYWEDLDIHDIDAIIADKGIVGMGGAGFPTPVKLKSPKPIDTILLNGCESEPYITADHRVMLEKADNIIAGLHIIMKSTGAERGIIVISDNKSDAIAHLEAKTAGFDDIFVMPLWSKYPQGAERMLILRSLGRQLDYGQRPFDAGAIVINVSTASAIGDAFIRGMPLISRAVTVSGEKVKNPGNYIIRIGTLVSDILDFCGVEDAESEDITIKLGGPMMGAELNSLDVPVIKGSNAIIAIEKTLSCSSDCIRCGRCVDVCPMELLPLYFPAEHDLLISGDRNPAICDEIRHISLSRPEVNAKNCIECAACDFICPSGIKIRDTVRGIKRIIS